VRKELLFPARPFQERPRPATHRTATRPANYSWFSFHTDTGTHSVSIQLRQADKY
jgi:hypothetical protein